MAKKLNLDMILVIEDDAYIEDLHYFNINFPIILEYLKKNKNDWNIFHGGPNINKHSSISKVHLHNPLLFDLSKCVLATFIIYNSNVYDFFINFLTIEEYKLKSNNKIDMLIYNKFNCITTYPCLIWQKEFKSNITGELRTGFKQKIKIRNLLFNRLIKKNNLNQIDIIEKKTIEQTDIIQKNNIDQIDIIKKNIYV